MWGDWPFGRTRAQWLQAPRFSLALVTPAVDKPITLDDAKAHARIVDEAENDNVERWIRAAARKVETDAEVSLLTQTWDVTMDHFPYDLSPITLPLRPLQSVTSVKYTNSTGGVITVDPATYITDSSTRRIGLASSFVWPSDLRYFQPIVIRVVAGWTDVGLIPDTLLQAVRLLVGTFAQNRELTSAESGLYDLLLSGESTHTFA